MSTWCSRQASATLWKQAMGQPGQFILWSRKALMVSGRLRITSSTGVVAAVQVSWSTGMSFAFALF